LPVFFYEISCVAKYYFVTECLAKNARSVLGAYGDEIGTWFGVVVPGEPQWFPVIVLRCLPFIHSYFPDVFRPGEVLVTVSRAQSHFPQQRRLIHTTRFNYRAQQAAPLHLTLPFAACCAPPHGAG